MKNVRQKIAIAFSVLAILTLTACERPPVDSKQTGYRGTGMDQINNPRTQEQLAKINEMPAGIPASPDGPKAGAVYKNIKVLNNLSTAQFGVFMVSMTSWVAPKEGCSYCHNVQNFADDSLYTKTVARRMIQMNQQINGNWGDHVKLTGVTCYTCHRGNNIPKNVWFNPVDNRGGNMLGNANGQNNPVDTVAYSSLPNQPFASYLMEKSGPARVIGDTALPTGNKASIQSTENVYGMMTHMSHSLGVNCTYCHNSRAFSSWEQSTPQRVQAWYGIQMLKDINTNFLTPLSSVFPANRLGPSGDVAKANCATCHQGVNKPLLGQSMLKDYPYLAPNRDMPKDSAHSTAQ
ncbi:photosynthetic reaction center cytochrome c subunit [Polynucleobacter paneuropaeus]|jgi:photosynthetic reaction center cytochrome c subunit|uniref:Photosynthetic reaction center cytochrome c subunit n=1 Tax=Polynucleobacter paneuropaeus TaxID=2527775 RepID=A0A9Q2WIA2_9BURK|nr:photosynthetic reaction center cytochrome PufC [Polynucleobacter paneuropaeus]MBT8522111.1 photosynthetic reaction center cytochrome c subunit [Polynucleobacter paneuropaeus]MBT8538354.1 photosynthetic reaction center cytochrome c subunit [Polynucleobacter paneuropaeus]MBT8545967.1 photosynthetic reaction center cytochrome c subunit [Polynucleobacter paneuropaeus]MBT8547242.1 photosynthetic reaction center cytochrome c subunit [Polynucleobacter paneuropaeus]MBT8551262.1 photosynthetic react